MDIGVGVELANARQEIGFGHVRRSVALRPVCSLSATLLRVYTWLAGSSPTRITVKCGSTPRLFQGRNAVGHVRTHLAGGRYVDQLGRHDVSVL